MGDDDDGGNNHENNLGAVVLSCVWLVYYHSVLGVCKYTAHVWKGEMKMKRTCTANVKRPPQGLLLHLIRKNQSIIFCSANTQRTENEKQSQKAQKGFQMIHSNKMFDEMNSLEKNRTFLGTNFNPPKFVLLESMAQWTVAIARQRVTFNRWQDQWTCPSKM
jgi:hypothetical protein